jgi:hypothetical protein
MAVTGGTTKIIHTQYNGLRTDISDIRVTDWGQSMLSSAIADNDTVLSSQVDLLYKDIQATHVHQTGSINTSVSVPDQGYIAAADTTQDYNTTTGAKTAVSGGTTMGWNDFDSAVITCQNYTPSHLGWPPGNFSPGGSTNSTRNPSWGTGGATTPTAIYHVVTATFTSLAARNHFFNAGGQITFSASGSAAGTGASQSKNQDWIDMLSAMGTVYFDKFNTTGASGTSGSNGYTDMNTNYKTLFTKTGSGAYDDNSVLIQGRASSNTVLRFRIKYNDGDVGTGNLGGAGTETPIDEPVTANITSSVSSLRPDSSFTYNSTTYTACSLPAPTLDSQVVLTANNSSDPA